MAKGDDTRARILELAMNLASREGLVGVTLGVLADELGLSKSGLYAHFRSKDALLLALLDHTRSAFWAHHLPYVAGKEGMAKLHAYLASWLDWIGAEALPGGCPLLGAAFEVEGKAGEVRDAVVAAHVAQEGYLRALVQGALPARGDAAVVDTVVSALRGSVLAYHVEARLLRDPHARARAEAAIARALAAAGA